jgi:hypothetical protein
MYPVGHLGGGAPVNKKYKVGVTFANPGIITIGTAVVAGVLVATTTSYADSCGLALDTATYTTTQATVALTGEALVTVSVRPDLIVGALMSGAATENTVLPTLTNTSASAGGTTITSTATGSNDMDSGTVWCLSGANVGQSRVITTHNSATSFVVTVPFPFAIAVGDTFLFCPWSTQGSGAGGVDGNANVPASTLLYQADASVASGTGGDAAVYHLETNGPSDSKVQFLILDHVYGTATL